MAIRRILFILAFLFICFGYAAKQNKTFAVTCAPTGTAPNFTISASCSFAASQMGVDAGTGTTNTANLTVTNGTLTVATGTTIGLGKITIGASGIVSNVGTTKLNAALYWTDADGDGYAVDPATTAVSLTGGTGKVRRDTLASTSVWDCDDNSYSTTNTCCTVATYYQDSDGDGYGNPAVSQSICPTAGWVANNTDCNDGSNQVWISHAQCYANMDRDPETAGLRANTTCLNAASCGSATAASASTTGAAVTAYTGGQIVDGAAGSNADCNDGDTTYYHGNGSWYSDGNDHNCSGGIEKQYSVISCSTCDPGNGHSGRRDDNGGIDLNAACGGSANYYASLGWGCYDSTTCPNQYQGGITQGCH